MVRARPLQDRADEHRRADRLDRLVDLAVGAARRRTDRRRTRSPARSPDPGAAPSRRRSRPPGSTSAATWLSSTCWARSSNREPFLGQPALDDRDGLAPAAAVRSRRPGQHRAEDGRRARRQAHRTAHARPPANAHVRPRARSGQSDASQRGVRQAAAAHRDDERDQGAPPSAANQRSGDSAWLNASRPHGNPPKGSRSRSASCSTHAAPAHDGAPAAGRVPAGPRRAPRRTPAKAAHKISQGPGPT